MEAPTRLAVNPPEQDLLSAGVDIYKPTMSQLAFEQEPNVDATFTFHNRGNQRLMDYVNPITLQERLEELQDKSWQIPEVNALALIRDSEGQHRFSTEFLEYLLANKLPNVTVRHDKQIDDIAIETTGKWPLATFWETVVMSSINEAYMEGYMAAHNIDPADVYAEGEQRLSEKIAILRANPDIKIAEFGTRRRFSLPWHMHVLERLVEECPDNIIGTSNVALAHKSDIVATGTYAHEMPMVYAALADIRGDDIRASHGKFLGDWYNRYGKDLSIALTDTFGSKFFFDDFSKEEAEMWNGTRHDSGDAQEYGDRKIARYEELGIDPTSKTVVFSDGLKMHTILPLRDHFAGRINALYGWGTSLTNDLGITALSVVMKATKVRLPETGEEATTVKLSDDAGKHTGTPEQVARYQEIFCND